MASESLTQRIRDALSLERGIEEKSMFGGVAFLLYGNMLVGVWKNSLVARIGPEAQQAALQKKHVSQFDITRRPMNGWVMIEPDGVESNAQLTGWIEQAKKFVEQLPPK